MLSQTATALKLRSEDGRFIKDVDISLFINDLPNKKDTHCFSTLDVQRQHLPGSRNCRGHGSRHKASSFRSGMPLVPPTLWYGIPLYSRLSAGIRNPLPRFWNAPGICTARPAFPPFWLPEVQALYFPGICRHGHSNGQL